MYIYAASSPALFGRGVIKIGSTRKPASRLATYLTGCAPGQTPSCDVDFYAIWQTSARTREELYDHEELVHARFARQRLMREIPGDSEWFCFNMAGCDALEMIRKVIRAQAWFLKEVEFEALAPEKRPPPRFLNTPCPANVHFVRDPEERMRRLIELQEPIIGAISKFFNDPEQEAGNVIAPCGAGKTVMTSKAVERARISCLIVCCPSGRIARQWKDALTEHAKFSASDILLVGQNGTTQPQEIGAFLARARYCIISTYMSSHLLTTLLEVCPLPQVVVLDEAHHMSGPVTSYADGTGEGRTRRLVQRCCELGVKRLALTYTPRFVTVPARRRASDSADAVDGDAEDPTVVLSMDDEGVFGPRIAELKIRTLIERGVLPDYRVWMLRDGDLNGSGIAGKAECLIEAWHAREKRRRLLPSLSSSGGDGDGGERVDVKEGDLKEVVHVLHHMVVFCITNEEARRMEEILHERMRHDGTVVLRVEQGQDLEKPLKMFEEAERAILINCFVLNEGVDIPRANAVAITYPKQSRGQITQMVLRAGRWRGDKPLFHVLLPVLGGEDLSGFEEVLIALASQDERIRDEIVYRCISREQLEERANRERSLVEGFHRGEEATRVMIDESAALEDDLRRCFVMVREYILPAQDSERIRLLCVEKGITTSVEYAMLREEIPNLPVDPRPRGLTWYAYLHRVRGKIMPSDEFATFLRNAKCTESAAEYEVLRGVHPSDVRERLPSVQNIADGCYGDERTTLMSIMCKTEKSAEALRRRR